MLSAIEIDPEVIQELREANLSPLALAAFGVLVDNDLADKGDLRCYEVAKQLKKGKTKVQAALEELKDVELAVEMFWPGDRPAECDCTWELFDPGMAKSVLAELTTDTRSCMVEIIAGPRSRPSAIAC